MIKRLRDYTFFVKKQAYCVLSVNKSSYVLAPHHKTHKQALILYTL